MDINFPISEKSLGLFNISIKGEEICNLMKRAGLELVAAAMRKQTRSYISVEALENPRYSQILILPDQTLSVTLFTETSYHGSAEPERTEYRVVCPYAVSLLLATYHLDAAKTYDDTCEVTPVIPEVEEKKKKTS